MRYDRLVLERIWGGQSLAIAGHNRTAAYSTAVSRYTHREYIASNTQEDPLRFRGFGDRMNPNETVGEVLIILALAMLSWIALVNRLDDVVPRPKQPVDL
ncbi:MAG: hypothetical protein O3C28_09500 [Proteobacteria bacterium]|nr:hypothetical protein [Pseudomonadota bacterium]